MAYTVLARRYRSRSFDELIGQEPVARTLRAAIDADRVAHAYLFCGTRGVGKTSMARIFADAINNPACDPDVANAIFSGQDSDVIEIDAASNRGIDEARDLIANSIYRPMRGPHKVYIIDEVHMLTREAFNALLKTMEEPPDHVKFILCTTEPHKVPPTIQSRCQRFDFRAVPAPVIADHLTAIIAREGLDAEPELVHAVARLGNGSVRDALSILDRLMASGEQQLTLALLEQILGLPSRDLVTSLINALADADPALALSRAAELLARGVSPELLLESLLERFRDLMVLTACGQDTELVDLTGQTRHDEATLAQRFDTPSLIHMIALCESVQRSIRTSVLPRALLDASIARMAMTERIAHAASLITETKPAAKATDRIPKKA